MNDLSFDIKSSEDFFNKLIEEFNDLQNDPLSSRHAINCAMTAWHLTDWIYWEFGLDKKYPKLPDFQKNIKVECESLRIMQDITNGSKHYHLTRHKPISDKTSTDYGTAFPIVFSTSFSDPYLKVLTKDSQDFVFIDEIEKVIEFWKNYLDVLIK